MKELTVAIDSLEAVEGALNDSFDQLDSKPAIRWNEYIQLAIWREGKEAWSETQFL